MTEVMHILFPDVNFLALRAVDNRTTLWPRAEAALQFLVRASSLPSESPALIDIEQLNTDSVDCSEFDTYLERYIHSRREKETGTSPAYLLDRTELTSLRCNHVCAALPALWQSSPYCGKELRTTWDSFAEITLEADRECQCNNALRDVYGINPGSAANIRLRGSLVVLERRAETLLKEQLRQRTLEQGMPSHHNNFKGTLVCLPLQPYHQAGESLNDASCFKRFESGFRSHDYYFQIDDDTAVHWPNLLRHISELNERYSSTQLIHRGLVSGRLVKDFECDPCYHGGSGLVISWQALKNFDHALSLAQNEAVSLRLLGLKHESSNEEHYKSVLTSVLALMHEFKDHDLALGFYFRALCPVHMLSVYEVARRIASPFPPQSLLEEQSDGSRCVLFDYGKNPINQRQRFNSWGVVKHATEDPLPWYYGSLDPYPAPIDNVHGVVSFHHMMRSDMAVFRSLINLNQD